MVAAEEPDFWWADSCVLYGGRNHGASVSTEEMVLRRSAAISGRGRSDRWI